MQFFKSEKQESKYLLTFRKQCSFSRHWRLLHFPTILLGYKAALSVVCRWETEAGLVPQRLSQSLTWHCHPKKQLLPKPQLSPSPGCHFCLLSGLAFVLVQPQDGLEQGLIEVLRAIPSHAGVTLWWNMTTDRLVPKLMLHEARRAVVTNSGCFEIPFTLGSGNSGVMKASCCPLCPIS